MVRFIKYLVLIPAVLAAGIGTAHAQTAFFASMTHAQETVRGPFVTSTGGTRPESFGTSSFVLSNDETTLSFTSTIFNIDLTGLQTPNDTNDNLTVAHIHASLGGAPGQNSPVVWGFFGTPDNDNNPDNLVVTPFVGGVGGTITSIWNAPEGNNGTTLAAQLANLRAGSAYINYHTVGFGGGEIRGQLTVVPEAGTNALIGSGLLVLAGGLIRKRRRN